MKKHIGMLMVVIVIFGLSIGYSALNSDLNIAGEATVKLLSLKERILLDNGGTNYIDGKGMPNIHSIATENEGMYASLDNDGKSYYFRGNVDNNYVSFAGYLWRIIRINGDGSIRLILLDGIDYIYPFNDNDNDENIYLKMYYSNSTLKNILEDWYLKHLIEFDEHIVTSEFCEEAKVSPASYYTFDKAITSVYSSYTPTFTCKTDGNGYGVVNAKIGLISYDEIVFAGGYYGVANTSYYLYTGEFYWAMTPAGNYLDYVRAFRVNSDGSINNPYVNITYQEVKPVISIDGNLTSTGNGTKENPYKI